MTRILDASVSTADDGETWDFACPVTTGCGDVGGAGFTSTGWPTKKAATARGRQHFDEHKGRGPAQTLEDFRRDQGLTVDAEGVVTVKDL